jgi:hypothetical protein
MALGDEPMAQMTSNEPRRSCQEDLHGAR